jgi:hypothetical protein
VGVCNLVAHPSSFWILILLVVVVVDNFARRHQVLASGNLTAGEILPHPTPSNHQHTRRYTQTQGGGVGGKGSTPPAQNVLTFRAGGGKISKRRLIYTRYRYRYEIHAPPATRAQISYRSRHIRSDDSLTARLYLGSSGETGMALCRSLRSASNR